MKPIYFPKGGNIVLVEYGSDGSLSFTPDKMTTSAGMVNSIQITANRATSDLQDGNSPYPGAVVTTGGEVTVEVNLTSFQPALFARLVGTTIDPLSSEDFWEVEEGMTVPSASPYTTTTAHAYKEAATFVLVTKDNSPFTKVASNPAAGQFSASGSTVTFNSADAGKEVLATYVWTAANGTGVGFEADLGKPQVLHAIMSGKGTTDDQLSKVNVNYVVDRCIATGDMNPPIWQKDPQGWSFTLRGIKPRSSQKMAHLKYNH